MTLQDPHFIPKNPARWRILADHLRTHPEEFATALENLDRWEQWGRTHHAPLRDWRQRILAAQTDPAARESLLAWLAADNEDAEPLKSCSPFVGILPS
jgi:hypothetical protein